MDPTVYHWIWTKVEFISLVSFVEYNEQTCEYC